MFLKRIELQGFKSFAEKTVIVFDKEMIGIVGPNGCGKSNINDAIRWVLGEQSVKSLRGNTMSDVIFSGSATKKSVNIAKVSLVFDNTKRFFPIEFDEVEITRCLHRINNENEYFINKIACRLKDITNLILDSGLGKDSLSIISQGNISAFAESKPQDRRAIFEEAASVAKYKKRKLESLSKLDRTNENLSRLNDIIYELEKQVAPLEKQSKKAKIYVEKKQRLSEIEVSVVVDDIKHFTQEKEQYQQDISQLQQQLVQLDKQLQLDEEKIEITRKSMYEYDFDINQLQEQFVVHLNLIKSLETRKIEIEEKRKYESSVEDLQKQKQILFEELSEIKYSLEDKQKRYNHLKTELNFNENEMHSLNQKYDLLASELNKTRHFLSNVQNEISVNERLQKQPYLNLHGVKTILEATHLYGVFKTVKDNFHPKENYEIAITSALNSVLNHIFVQDSEAAKQAVHYLKRNNSGRATFLPLNLLKPRSILREHQIICESVVSYLGVASDFVVCDKKYEEAKLSLLGNILICEHIDGANELANRLKHQYKIITLDGDVIHRGGSITGGSIKQTNTIYLLEKQAQKLQFQEKTYVEQLSTQQKQLHLLNNDKSKLQSQQLKIQLDMAKLHTVIESLISKKEKCETLFNQIHVDKEIALDFDTTFIKQLNDAHTKQDELNSLIQSKRSYRLNLSNELEKLEQNVKLVRREYQQLQVHNQNLQLELVKSETKLENLMQVLRTQYQMTFEFAQTKTINIEIQSAREEVLKLKNEITALGNVNLDAIEQYETVSKRYELLTTEVMQLTSAKEEILNAIDEMDEMMKKQFKTTFDEINIQLGIVFKSLFPLGHAKLTLVDENDLLNTGIDVSVSFPGKTLKNIRLFSGGEKALVAICVLFAIIKARTMPLCIFDEVEAALDQVNVDKFANYIATLKNETQFIVVTHRPGTMVKCDKLFGVTMQQSGISNILSVQLEDAISMVNTK